MGEFQCPFGHSGILTHPPGTAAMSCLTVSMPFRAFGDSDALDQGTVQYRHRWVSMPFRAFGDSDTIVAASIGQTRSGFQCPFGHSGILTGTIRAAPLGAPLCFNALSGIRGF